MRAFLADYLPWLLSLVTILATELLGRKWRWAWAVSLGNQALWLTWIAAASKWGFLPLTLVLSLQYLRNHLAWARKGPQNAPGTPQEPLSGPGRGEG